MERIPVYSNRSNINSNKNVAGVGCTYWAW